MDGSTVRRRAGLRAARAGRAHAPRVDGPPPPEVHRRRTVRSSPADSRDHKSPARPLTPSAARASLRRGSRVSRILKSLGVVAAVAAALPVLSGAAPARVAANSTTYQDSTGEDAQGPDITTVIASNDNTGLITFQINIPSQASLSGVKITDIEIDADSS